MPASYITGSEDIFGNGKGSADALVLIPGVDECAGAAALAVYDSVSLQVNETVQYFLTFDDATKFIHYGKGVGTIQAQGTMYPDCTNHLPGAKQFKKAVSGLRGKAIQAMVGSVNVTAVLTNAQITILTEPTTMAQFVFTLAIVNHGL
jgi:hypothetical protein